jgi:hypothetical protein
MLNMDVFISENKNPTLLENKILLIKPDIHLRMVKKPSSENFINKIRCILN